MLYFFLFKQKTAYELRISDWSSYVCSSDLTRVGRKPPLPHSLKLNDLDDGSVSSPDLKALPGIDKDPLARLRKAAGKEPLKGLRAVTIDRSAERRVGKECVSKCRSRWSPYH